MRIRLLPRWGHGDTAAKRQVSHLERSSMALRPRWRTQPGLAAVLSNHFAPGARIRVMAPSNVTGTGIYLSVRRNELVWQSDDSTTLTHTALTGISVFRI